MARRGRKRRAARRALVGATLASAIALMGTQFAQGGQDVCTAGHGTVAAASAQQFESVFSAAEAGNPQAMVEVGHMYRDGHGVKRDLVMARAWLGFAAYNGAAVKKEHQAVSNCLSTPELRKADAALFSFLQREES